MYFIVSADKTYRGKLIGVDHFNRANTIGHEIHMTRPILLFLLANGLITVDDTIVTKSNERFFLYSNIFKNIIEYKDLPIDIDDAVDLTTMNTLFEEKHNFNVILDVEKKYNILSKIRDNSVTVKTDTFNELIANIHYCDIDPQFLNKSYIVIHHRHVTYNNVTSDDLSIIQAFINIIVSNFPDLNVVVFSSVSINFNHPSVHNINDISVYASFMNNEKCIAIISQFSGGGQLAQYCHSKNIIFYNNTYNMMIYNEKNERIIDQVFEIANRSNNIYDYFDYQKITNANVYIISAFQHVFEIIKKIMCFSEDNSKNQIHVL